MERPRRRKRPKNFIKENLKFCQIKFVKKKKEPTTYHKYIFREEDGSLRIRALVDVQPHIIWPHGKNFSPKPYCYGRIQVDVDTEAIDRQALVRIYIPNHPIDESDVFHDAKLVIPKDVRITEKTFKFMAQSTLAKFLYQEENEWDDIFKDRFRVLKTEKQIAKKINEQKMEKAIADKKKEQRQ
jgi:hypothetical protein